MANMGAMAPSPERALVSWALKTTAGTLAASTPTAPSGRSRRRGAAATR
jgi:hypothetical protein